MAGVSDGRVGFSIYLEWTNIIVIVVILKSSTIATTAVVEHDSIGTGRMTIGCFG